MTLKPDRTIALMYKQYENRQSKGRFSCPADALPKRSFTYKGGRPPYGWVSFDGKLTEFEPEQKIIRLIYRMSKDGYRRYQIADYLNRLGVLTKSGKPWAGHRLKHILKGVPDVVARQNKAQEELKEGNVLVGYVRVSGDAQEDGESLPIQRQVIEEYCRENNHTLRGIFEDVGSGAQIDNRKGLQFALSTILSDLADGIVIYRLDRFSRKALDAEFLMRKFRAKGKTLLSVTDPIDLDTKDGQFFYQVKSAFAEYERKQIALRCKSGRARKRENYGYYTGGPPYGWIPRNGTLEPFEPEQTVIGLINELRKQGLSQQKIANYLNDQGLTTKKGRPWKQAQVWSVLQGVPGVVARIEAGKIDLEAMEKRWQSSSAI